ncbi:MAG: TetR/AcrR family transcriptional regulator [Labilithrix sp.]|nr:TetR/AcrR family transcriptional regulator [Labilithrix sp.]
MSESSLSLRRRRASRGREDARPPREGAAAREQPADGPRATSRQTGDKRRRVGDKRDRILKAAVKVFARSGFHATRVSEVAKAAGVADGTIYLYFESKEELLFSLFEDRVSKLLAFMRDELPKKPDAPARLRAIIDMQLGLLEGERDLAEVITVILRQSTRLMKEFAAPHFNAYLDAIAKIIADGQATGAFRQDVSPHIAARAIFGALDGITLTWALGRAEQGALGRAAGQLADVLLRGLAP